MWDDDQEYKRELRKKIATLKQQGWKVVKNDFDVEIVKHPQYGMMTVDRALKGDYDVD